MPKPHPREFREDVIRVADESPPPLRPAHTERHEHPAGRRFGSLVCRLFGSSEVSENHPRQRSGEEDACEVSIDRVNEAGLGLDGLRVVDACP